MDRRSTRKIVWTALIGVALGFSAAASAQGLNRAVVNRPSLQGPSQTLGLIGGVFTGRFGDEAGRSLSGLSNPRTFDAAVGQATQGFGRFGYRGGFSRGNFGGNVLPGIATPTAAYADFGYRPAPTVLQQLTPTTSMMEAMSGLGGAMSPDLPLGVSFQNSLPRSLPNLAPPRSVSPYHDFFGLVPASDGPSQLAYDLGKPGVVSEPILQTAALETLENQQRMRNMSAVSLFRDATRSSATTVEHYVQLENTARELESWRRNDTANYVPALLLGHVALERDALTHALTALSDATRRNPELFVQKIDPGAYFGDREVFQKQLRKYIRTRTDAGEESPEALVVEAYCALQLGDKIRAKEATEKAEKLALERSFSRPVESGGVDTLIWAIRAAVQQ
ncbi:MAG: hypothetical protein SF069_14110 [Phycisphaerae bacterium]|nr:hypothetical protein [Phycisphaerae bacterium]